MKNVTEIYKALLDGGGMKESIFCANPSCTNILDESFEIITGVDGDEYCCEQCEEVCKI